jgi:hypothetical protein
MLSERRRMARLEEWPHQVVGLSQKTASNNPFLFSSEGSLRLLVSTSKNKIWHIHVNPAVKFCLPNLVKSQNITCEREWKGEWERAWSLRPSSQPVHEMAVIAWGPRFDSGRRLFPRRSQAAQRVAYVSGAVRGRAGRGGDSTQRTHTDLMQCWNSWNKQRYRSVYKSNNTPFVVPAVSYSCIACQIPDSNRNP